jgi:hypothetical protein
MQNIARTLISLYQSQRVYNAEAQRRAWCLRMRVEKVLRSFFSRASSRLAVSNVGRRFAGPR